MGVINLAPFFLHIMITRNTKFNRIVFAIVMIIAILWVALELN